MSEPWPPLWSAPKVDFKKYDHQIHRTKISSEFSDILVQAKKTYKVIKKYLQ